jgi:hypothetical protein
MTKAENAQARTGGETAPERFLDRHLGNAVHLFLTFLAVLILVAAAIATFEIIIRALLLLFHRTSAAVEVLIFVIARKMVISGISGLDLLAGVAALGGLVVLRFYFITQRAGSERLIISA